MHFALQIEIKSVSSTVLRRKASDIIHIIANLNCSFFYPSVGCKKFSNVPVSSSYQSATRVLSYTFVSLQATAGNKLKTNLMLIKYFLDLFKV